MSDSRYRLVYTSDRYDLAHEVQALSELTDIDVELISGVVETPDELIALAKDADALVVSSREAVPRVVIESLEKCRVITRMSVGIDHVDLEAATDHGIIVSHCPDYCTDEVADHAMALILALNRQIVFTNEDLHKGAWVARSYHTQDILRMPMPPLRELTVGIVGFGRIGQAVGRRLKPFGPRIIVNDPYLDPGIGTEVGVELVSLDELAAQSDTITLHCQAFSDVGEHGPWRHHRHGRHCHRPFRRSSRRRRTRCRGSRAAPTRLTALPVAERHPHTARCVLFGTLPRAGSR
jgi:D-3-phosphoglycerate dehydrogenase